MMNTDTPDVTDGHAGRDRGISPRLDATLELLSNQRRRYVLYHLRQKEGPVTVDELADRVAAWETESDADRTHVRTDLYHSQLPRLDEAGVVDFDPEDGYVSLAGGVRGPIAEYLDLAADEENVA